MVWAVVCWILHLFVFYYIHEIEMDGLSILLGVLTFIFILVIVGMNSINSIPGILQTANGQEGFQDEKASVSASTKIRKVLDKMTNPKLCPLFTTIRENMAKNAKAGQDISQKEVANRVEADLAIKIPGGALPCPLLKYPKDGATDLEWLDFLQKVPSDFGARVVLMAIFAKDFLGTTQQTLQDALSGKGTPPTESGTDGFTVCSPDVADTRRAEKLKQATASGNNSCVLPEDMSPQQIDDAIMSLLQKLVATKNIILKAKKIDPLIDINPLITQASASAAYIKQKSDAAQSGTLAMDSPIQKPVSKEKSSSDFSG
jgi:hypothetical protein